MGAAYKWRVLNSPSKTEQHDFLLRFVPGFVQRRLAANPQPLEEARLERMQAAIAFADISGFTPLAARLAEHGAEGAEELNRILSLYYTALVDTVLDAGGDIIAFAGDAALIVWPAQSERDLPQQVLRAAQAAQEIVRIPGEKIEVTEVQLSEKITITCGQLEAAEVGGIDGSWQPIVMGTPLRELGAAASLIEKDEVLLTPSAWEVVRDRVRGQQRENHFLLQRIVDPPAPSPMALPVLGEATTPTLRGYLPPAVAPRLESGHFDWLAELRHVTVIFAELRLPEDRDSLTPLMQEIMQVHQQAMLRFEGTLIQLLQDDKGTVSLACFGLPPLQHENDALHAVRAALAIHEGLEAIGVGSSFGLSTGRIFCGPRGSDRRCEYAVTGEVVIRAARIMSKARGIILCDPATHQAAERFINFEERPPLELKGMPEPVPVFTPRTMRERPQSAAASGHRLFGRDTMLGTIRAGLEKLIVGESLAILIEGEPGIGKTTLVEGALEGVATDRLQIFRGENSPIESDTLFYAWRTVFSSLLGFEREGESREAEKARLIARLGDQAELAPLLNTLLGLDFPENDLVRQLSDELRFERLQQIVLQLVSETAGERPILIIIDDSQWLDSASWALALRLAQRVPRVGLIFMSRPMSDPPAEWQGLLDLPQTEAIRLDELDATAVQSLACQKLGVARIEQRLNEFLYERSRGNPFFADQLITYLEQSAYLYLQDDWADIRDSEFERAQKEVPSTLRALITSRLDQLSFEKQLTMKAASVIGIQFARQILLAIHPDHPGETEMSGHLREMLQRELARLETAEPDLIYMFRHATIQQVVYDQLTVAQREPLHRAIAQWYEETFGTESTVHFSLLAYHWGKGEVTEKEVHYLDLAGRDALTQYANRKAAQFFALALQQHRELHGDRLSASERLRRSNWERLLGEAHFRLGNLAEAQTHLEQSLVVERRPLFTQPLLLPLHSVWQLGVQAGHRLFLRNDAVPDESALDPIHETALACQRLSQLHYLQSDMGRGINRALRGMNYAERHGRTIVLARSYSGVGLAIGMLGLFRISETYGRLAIETARATGHRLTIAYVLMALGIYRISVAQWEKAEAEMAEAIRICEELGDTRQHSECLTVQAMIACFRADFPRTRDLFEQLEELAKETENMLHFAWSLSGRAEALLRLGELDRAARLAQFGLQKLENQDHHTDQIRLHGFMTLIYWRQANREEAIRWMELTMAAIERCNYATVSTLEGFGAVAEVSLRLAEIEPDDGRWLEQARAIEKIVRKYAKVYPVWRPRHRMLGGALLWREGQTSRADHLWQEGIRLAEEFELPLEKGLVAAEAVRHRSTGSPERGRYGEIARSCFDRIGAKGDLAALPDA